MKSKRPSNLLEILDLVQNLLFNISCVNCRGVLEHNVEPKKRIGARIVLKGAESHIYAEAFRAEKKSIELLAKVVLVVLCRT